MRVRHLTQRGRSIGESELSVKDEVMRLTLIRRELDTLGHRQLPKKRTVIGELKSARGIRLFETGHNSEGILFSEPGTLFHRESSVARSPDPEASSLARRVTSPGLRRASLCPAKKPAG